MLKLELTKPYKAKAIHLKGSSKPLRDCIVFIAGNFLVVAQDMNDTAPHMVQRRPSKQAGRRRTDRRTAPAKAGSILLTAYT